MNAHICEGVLVKWCSMLFHRRSHLPPSHPILFSHPRSARRVVLAHTVHLNIEFVTVKSRDWKFDLIIMYAPSLHTK